MEKMGYLMKRADAIMERATTVMRKSLNVYNVLLILVFAFAIGMAGCDGSTSSSSTVNYDPEIIPANFVTGVDNQYMTLTPGRTLIYESVTAEGTERIEVLTTTQTKVILGVTCMVVSDKGWLNSVLTEETSDWFAQDIDGNVWYFGEDSKEYAGGVVVSTGGSWEAGVDGAKPGIIMQGDPQIGDTYRQEYYAGEAEDKGKVLAFNQTAVTTYGTYTDCLKTKDWNPLENDVEHKYYSPTIGGVVMEVGIKGGTDVVELISITP